jgi:hypothetical protein
VAEQMTIEQVFFLPNCCDFPGPPIIQNTGSAKKYIHILRDVIYVLLFEVELNYGSKVRSKDGVNQMNAFVTMRQAGQSKKMTEARLSFEGLSITILIQLFSFLKMCIHFLAPPVYSILICHHGLARPVHLGLQ